jgi:hypothetical protein
MAKSKKGSQVENVNEENPIHLTEAQPPALSEVENPVRILFRGKCPKLSARGMGDLEYELGSNNITGQACIRISGNASSGAFNAKWIDLEDIRKLIDTSGESSFKAVLFQPLYKGQSSNNHGYLCAILKAEGILNTVPDQQASLKGGNWDILLEKINTLKDAGISLTDHIAGLEIEKAKTRKKKVSGEKD